MKIGIDARLPAYQMGGISRYVIQLVDALAELEGDGNYVVYRSRKDEAERFPKTEKVALRTLWTPCHHRFERWLLSVELFATHLDVFHSPDFIPPFSGGRKHVVTVHDLNFLYYPQFLTRESRRYYAEQIDWAVAHADHIIADSVHTKKDLVEQLSVSPQKVSAIYLAADPVFADTAGSASAKAIRGTLNKYGLQPGFVLFVGTVEPRKNLRLLLDAFDILWRTCDSGLQLVIAGRKGWLYADVFQRIEALDLQGKVRHIGSTGDAELAHLYLSAGVLALPSHYEGFGLPVLEAMHCRCPVIASDRASLPEVVGDAGILLPPDEPAAWAGALGNVLYDQGQRRQMIAAGLEQASRFSWARTAAETRRVYERLA